MQLAFLLELADTHLTFIIHKVTSAIHFGIIRTVVSITFVIVFQRLLLIYAINFSEVEWMTSEDNRCCSVTSEDNICILLCDVYLSVIKAWAHG